MSKPKLLLAAALSIIQAVAPALASPPVPARAAAPSAVIHVWHGGWGWGPWALLGIGTGVVIGSIIADERYRPRPGYYYDDAAYDGPYYYPANYRGDPRAICAQSFRSFEWQTGYYTTHSGERRLCPYLRG
jgi:hypothetical protein